MHRKLKLKKFYTLTTVLFLLVCYIIYAMDTKPKKHMIWWLVAFALLAVTALYYVFTDFSRNEENVTLTDDVELQSQVRLPRPFANVFMQTQTSAIESDCDFVSVDIKNAMQAELEIRGFDPSHYCGDVEIRAEVLDGTISNTDRFLTYRVIITNHGPHTVHAVRVNNVVSPFFLFHAVSGDISHGSYSSTHDMYLVPQLASKSTTYLDFTVFVPDTSCGAVYSISPRLASFLGFDYNNVNNSNTITFAIPHCSQSSASMLLFPRR